MKIYRDSALGKLKYYTFLVSCFFGLVFKSRAFVLECFDPRLIKHWKRFIVLFGIDPNDYTRLQIAGAAKCFSGVIGSYSKERIFDPNFRIAFESQKISKAYILFHNDCGAYKDLKLSEFEEFIKQAEDSLNVGHYIKDHWKNVEVLYVHQRLRDKKGKRMDFVLMTEKELVREINSTKIKTVVG